MNYKDVVEDGVKIKFRKGYLNRLTEKLKKRYNYQDGAYSLFYMDGLDFPAFRRLPVKVKRQMTLKDIPGATRTGAKKRFNSTIQLFSMIIIFRTTCPKFEELNGYDPSTFNKNPNPSDCESWNLFGEEEMTGVDSSRNLPFFEANYNEFDESNELNDNK